MTAGLIIGCACLALGVAYFLLIQWVIWQWHKLPVFEPAPVEPAPSVTILVAARNEAVNIRHCLQALARQDYPEQALKIVVVDDHSTDGTAAIVEAFPHPHLTLLRLPAGQYGKKRALELGAAATQSTYLLTTDADCQPPPLWVQGQVQHLESRELAASTGPVLLTGVDDLRYRFQALDMAGMMVLTAVGLHTGSWMLGNGASLACRRTAFEAAGGYADNRGIASGDDIFLIAKIAGEQGHPVRFLKSAAVAVPTPAAPDWPAFFRQRLRWGTKNAAAPASAGTTFALGIAFLLSWSVLLSPLLFLAIGHLWLIVLGLLLLLKSGADYRLLKTACRFFQQEHLLKSFARSEALHIGYIAFIGLASLFVRKYEWKGRSVH
jgi:cellulose synthase/poly-beta-1,6-N-acetylglucosamine synthase-like glycosyltransferase